MAVAAIREEGAASRAKDSENRLKIYEAIGELHKDVNTIKRTIEASKLHPYNAGRSSVFGGRSISPLSPCSSSPPSKFYIPPHPYTSTLLPTTEGLRDIIRMSGAKVTTGVIDLSNIQDTPSPSPTPPLPTFIEPALFLSASMISASPKEDSSIMHYYDGPIPECGRAKAPSTAAPLGTNKPAGGKKGNQKMPATPLPPRTNTRAKAEHKAATPSKTPPKSQRGIKGEETSISQNSGKEELEAPQTPTPSVRISPEPGTDSPMRNGSKAYEEITTSIMEDTIDTANKNLKATVEHKERYWKLEAKAAVEEQGKAKDLAFVPQPTAPRPRPTASGSAKKSLPPPLSPHKQLQTPPTANVITQGSPKRRNSNGKKTDTPSKVRPDWDSTSDSEEEAAEVLVSEFVIQQGRLLDRAAKKGLLDDLKETGEDKNRSPRTQFRVKNAVKEIESQDSDAETT
ncbi:hypothetical protein BGX38DRAFT_1264909 [Terfezia claveryi]|nr:hypothetical protein BGX38DRAFT_1264909 [Terfezia claveryi]